MQTQKEAILRSMGNGLKVTNRTCSQINTSHKFKILSKSSKGCRFLTIIFTLVNNLAGMGDSRIKHSVYHLILGIK